jgi:hypothetical protein
MLILERIIHMHNVNIPLSLAISASLGLISLIDSPDTLAADVVHGEATVRLRKIRR